MSKATNPKNHSDLVQDQDDDNTTDLHFGEACWQEEELEFTTRLTREDVAGLIEAMAESLKEGLFKVQKSDNQLILQPPRVVDLEVHAVRNTERSSFMFEVSWRNKPIEVPEEPVASAENPTPPKTPKAGKKTAKHKD